MRVLGTAAIIITLLGLSPSSPAISLASEGKQVEIVANGSFNDNTKHWQVQRGQKRWLAKHKNHRGLLVLKAYNRQAVVANNISFTPALSKAQASVTGKSLKRPTRVRLTVTETLNGRVVDQKTTSTIFSPKRFKTMKLALGAKQAEARYSVRLTTGKLRSSERIVLDTVHITGVKQEAQQPVDPTCAISSRGLPSCGAYVGGAYKGNASLGPWEATAGKKLAIHRTFWRADQVNSAIETSRQDLAANRLPWISFKLPAGWDQMAVGQGDAWARNMAIEVSKLNGPVWVAFHHEPENDEGNLRSWTKLQERLGPILRANAPNAAFTVILMGYHQLPTSPNPALKLDALMPNTKVDVLGMDPYNHYSPAKRTHTDFKPYFELFNNYAKAHAMAWAVAETGLGPEASLSKPTWISDAYKLMVQYDGIAFSYFNSNLNSTQNYEIDTQAEHKDFRTILDESVYLK